MAHVLANVLLWILAVWCVLMAWRHTHGERHTERVRVRETENDFAVPLTKPWGNIWSTSANSSWLGRALLDGLLLRAAQLIRKSLTWDPCCLSGVCSQ